MTCFEKILFSALAVTSLLFSSGCGYRIGAKGMMHPQVKTIAVGTIQNDTLEPLAATLLKQQIAESFQRDGSLELKNLGEADAIIHAKVLDVSNRTISTKSYDRDATKRPSEFTLTITIEFSVILPGRGQPLVPTRTVSGSASYQYLADPAISRANALKQACYSASKMLVQYTTEAW